MKADGERKVVSSLAVRRQRLAAPYRLPLLIFRLAPEVFLVCDVVALRP